MLHCADAAVALFSEEFFGNSSAMNWLRFYRGDRSLRGTLVGPRRDIVDARLYGVVDTYRAYYQSSSGE